MMNGLSGGAGGACAGVGGRQRRRMLEMTAGFVQIWAGGGWGVGWRKGYVEVGEDNIISYSTFLECCD